MLKLYNTLSKKIEKFESLVPGKVGMYTCGPTVYDFPHIGNWRTFVFEDIVRRVLEYNDYKVTQVMNATDVGHLSGDNLGDADTGEDRLERGAKREGKTVWEVAQEYIDDFIETRSWLNILPPTHFTRATEHIGEQIELIKRLADRGLAYETETGVFFEVEKYPEYGKLSGQKLVDKRVAVREEVEKDQTKHNPADFALWFKLVGKFSDHQMHWPSPWGQGFPGWHIECSAMAMKYLGESFDIHCGGVDHIAIHHANEIAQSEGATGKEFAKYWLHGEFLMVDGGRMGKSLGNAYNLHQLKGKGFDPLVLRYFYLTSHYRTVANFTFEGLEGSRAALVRLGQKISALQQSFQEDLLEMAVGCAGYEGEFLEAVNDDLNMPRALAVIWKLVDDKEMPAQAILASLFRMDKVLGLDLGRIKNQESRIIVPVEINSLLKVREEARKNENWIKSDKIRAEIDALGWIVEDNSSGQKVTKK